MITKELDITQMINILLDAMIQHGDLKIYCEIPLSLEVKENGKEKYLSFTRQ